jgi:hypothetical protein
MSRNRVIYQSDAILVSQDASSSSSEDHSYLELIQSANYGFNINRQDINQYGQLARLDSIASESPTVSFDISYYIVNGYNESQLGFKPLYDEDGISIYSQPQFVGGHITGGSGKNFYIITSQEGEDLNTLAVANVIGKQCIGIGNAYITNYSVDFAVGSVPTASASFEAANIRAFNISSGVGGIGLLKSAAIDIENGNPLDFDIEVFRPATYPSDREITALRPGDVKVYFGGEYLSNRVLGLMSEDTEIASDGFHLQSCNLSISLSRSIMQKLGSKFAFSRNVDLPIKATISLNGLYNENYGDGDLKESINSGLTDIIIEVKDPRSDDLAIQFIIKKAKLESSSVSSSIGSNKTLDFVFSTQIGGVNDVNRGIFLSGASSYDWLPV